MAKTPKKQTELVWANEIMEVFRNLGTEAMDCRWSTKSAKYLWTWTREDAKNEDKFLTSMVPKATDIIAKHGLADAADAVLEIDAKTIRDLKLLLADAVSVSQDDEVVVNEGQEPGHLPGHKPTTVEIDQESVAEPTLEDLF